MIKVFTFNWSQQQQLSNKPRMSLNRHIKTLNQEAFHAVLFKCVFRHACPKTLALPNYFGTKELICGVHTTLRTSKEFIGVWKELISKATSEPQEPAFFQDITDQMFEEMVVATFPLDESTLSARNYVRTPDNFRLNCPRVWTLRTLTSQNVRSIRKNDSSAVAFCMRLIRRARTLN